jgi:hypothetical protein
MPAALSPDVRRNMRCVIATVDPRTAAEAQILWITLLRSREWPHSFTAVIR